MHLAKNASQIIIGPNDRKLSGCSLFYRAVRHFHRHLGFTCFNRICQDERNTFTKNFISDINIKTPSSTQATHLCLEVEKTSVMNGKCAPQWHLARVALLPGGPCSLQQDKHKTIKWILNEPKLYMSALLRLSMMFCSKLCGSWETAWSKYWSSLLMLDTGMPKDWTNSSSCWGSRSWSADGR